MVSNKASSRGLLFGALCPAPPLSSAPTKDRARSGHCQDRISGSREVKEGHRERRGRKESKEGMGNEEGDIG